MKKINNILLLLVSIVVASSAITKFPIAISSKIYKTPTTIASNSSTITLSKSETTTTKASSFN